MKLLYVCSDFGIPPGGTKGASIHLRSITAALARLDHDVRLLSPLEDPDDRVGVPMLSLPGCSAVRKNAKAIRQWLDARDYDTAVSKEFRALSYNAMAAPAALAAMDSWRPAAVVERLSLFGHVGLDVARAYDVPLIIEVNALLTEEAAAFRSLELRSLAAAIEQRVLQQADAVIAVSAPLARAITERGVDTARVHVVPNGVDLQAFETAAAGPACRTRLGLQDAFVVGFCGSLKPWHGVDVLVEAFELLSRDDATCRLLIVGTGPSEDGLRDEVRARGLGDRVHFTGAVPHERIAEYLGAMDVAVAPFRSMDNFYFSPIKLFEYMAAETCVVASALGQIAEVVEHGRNGLLCNPDDPRALCAALAAARRKPQQRQGMAAAARRDVAGRYTWDHAAEHLGRIVAAARTARNGGAAQLAQPRSGRMEVVS